MVLMPGSELDLLDRGQRVVRWSFLLVFLVLTFLLLGSLVWDLSYYHAGARKIAIAQARAYFNKDQAIRHWVTFQGGVYVPATEHTPPNPYLEHVPKRDITDDSDRQLTMMNPAYVLRQINEKFHHMYGVGGHITSLKPLRPENAPDEWEVQALKKFETGSDEITEEVGVNGNPVLRLMRPMVTNQGCLKCHAHQGYKEGDIRGGVSVAIPMDDLYNTSHNHCIILTVGHLALWLLVGTGIWYTRGVVLGEMNKRKGMMTERERLLRELSSKTEHMQSIIYTSSHDLRSPMINIKGFTEDLKHNCDKLKKMIDSQCDKQCQKMGEVIEQDLEEDIDYIDKSITKMELLLSGLVQISRMGTMELHLQDIDMNALFERLLPTLEHRVREYNAEIDIEDLPPCRGDERLVNQVFSNLLDNALKYRDPSRRPEICISGRVAGDSAIYVCSDNGMGIKEEYAEKVFELFHQLDPSHKAGGSGLGLTIVKQILGRLGGNIYLDTSGSIGATFYVYLLAVDERR